MVDLCGSTLRQIDRLVVAVQAGRVDSEGLGPADLAADRVVQEVPAADSVGLGPADSVAVREAQEVPVAALEAPEAQAVPAAQALAAAPEAQAAHQWVVAPAVLLWGHAAQAKRAVGRKIGQKRERSPSVDMTPMSHSIPMRLTISTTSSSRRWR